MLIKLSDNDKNVNKYVCVHIYNYIDLDDSGIDLTMDIDIQEATSHIRKTPGTFTSV